MLRTSLPILVALTWFSLPEKELHAVAIVNAHAPSTYIGDSGQRTLAWGGLLTNSEGSPLTGSFDLSFGLYDDPTSTDLSSLVWQETLASVAVQDGHVGLQLGSNSPLGSALDDYNGLNRFLEVSVNGGIIGRTDLNTPGLALDGGTHQVRGILASSTYVAEVGSRSLAFGGTLTNLGGAALNGTHDLTFRIYDDPTSTDPSSLVWQDTLSSVSVQDGRVGVQLGTNAPLGSAMDDYNGQNRFLEVLVDGGDPLPRLPLNTPGSSEENASLQLSDALASSVYTAESGARTLAFGGSLLDEFGAPLSGTYDLTFSLYDDPTSTDIFSLLWQETVTSVSVQAGGIGLQLGESVSLGSVLDDYNGMNRYLEIMIDGEPALGRLPLNVPGIQLGSYSSPASNPVIPEPSSLMIWSIAMISGMLLRKRRRA